jgi:hypothetical protein
MVYFRIYNRHFAFFLGIFYFNLGDSVVTSCIVKFIICSIVLSILYPSMVITLSFGEAIWSPRTYDYTMTIAPLGKEASFSALASAPLFAAKVPVGLLSGYLLSLYVPENGHKDPQKLWLIIGLLTLASPICIYCFERYLYIFARFKLLQRKADFVPLFYKYLFSCIREPSKVQNLNQFSNLLGMESSHAAFVIKADSDDDDIDDEVENDATLTFNPVHGQRQNDDRIKDLDELLGSDEESSSSLNDTSRDQSEDDADVSVLSAQEVAKRDKDLQFLFGDAFDEEDSVSGDSDELVALEMNGSA